MTENVGWMGEQIVGEDCTVGDSCLTERGDCFNGRFTVEGLFTLGLLTVTENMEQNS